ncbi:glycosyltransferase family 2 protein [Paraburkholderia unamae]|uniref:Glycosyl transferase family 2 n=1 Tax=Paraburkholderia unamae TaxID=219649 RepID=A0ABX5KK65_9BURK|nr:glycosyltransferase [Paraburkholderia unamae]PVX82252.1 glycosyl transferase family 2 [Paraburkholderia unamae]RAR60581.1 glycosyl transferase family 2 [Paraburkholderia unamae]CAG9249668.1 Glycosyltransferase, GT2 family [Paraburkholderia unamae]
MSQAFSLSVVVPTYRRPADLARCLAALDAQERPADEVIVVARADDHATHDLLRTRVSGPGTRNLRVAPVTQPGVVAAYNMGLETSRGELVCFTDDDAAPHPDWTRRLEEAFIDDDTLGGIGGRDIVHERGTVLTGAAPNVGLVRWYGRAIGNHHIGAGPRRRVQVLKAVNMAFRRAAVTGIRFDERLLGSGAQVHCEMQFSLDVVRRAWTLMYDPTILVDHFPAQRADEDQRYVFNRTAFYNASFNLRLIMRDHLSPAGRWAFIFYATLIGTRADPGLGRALTLAFGRTGPTVAMQQWWIGVRALFGAWQQDRR